MSSITSTASFTELLESQLWKLIGTSEPSPWWCQLSTNFPAFLPESHFDPSNMSRFVLALFLATQLAMAFGAKCTFYGSPGETGEQTANEESFDPMGMTCAALAHFPFGTVLRVTNQINGRSITVRVNDRYGSPPSEESLDLTYGAFGVLADHDDGVIPCSIEVL